MSDKKLLFCLACTTFTLSTQLSAQGITIQSGAQLVVNGSAHLVVSDGNFINNGTFVGDNSTVHFTGSGLSSVQIGGTSATDFQNIIIERSAENVELQQHINVAGEITMSSHDLLLGTFVADLGTTGSVSNENEGSKIIGSTTGSLNRTIDLNQPNAINPGNIGLEITSASNLGTTTIKRYNGVLAVSGLDNSINRYYDITPTNNNNLDATLTIHYFDSELGLLDENLLNVWFSNNSGSTWKFYSKSSANTTSNIVTKDHLDTLARYTLASNNINAVLAVKLLSFTAIRDRQYARLSWITSQEINNDHFEVERSSDGQTFVAIGTVLSKGDNNSPQSYNFTDIQPGNSAYYRIKMVDKDHTYEYSKIVSLPLGTAEINNAVTVFPVPVINKATVKITSVDAVVCKYRLVDAAGNTVYTGSWNLEKGVNTMPLSMAQFAGGMYYLHFSGITLNPVRLYKQ